MIFLRRIFAIPLVLVVAFFVFIFGFNTAKAAVVFDNTTVPLPQNIDFNNRILSLPTNFRINLPDTKSHIGSVRLWVAHETAQYFANLYCNGILPGCDESQWNSGFGFGLINLQIGWNGTFCIARPNNGNPSAIFFKDSPDHTWTEVTLILNDNYNSGSPEMTGCAIPADDSGNNFINTLSFGVGYGWTIATTPEGMPIMQVFDVNEQKVPVLIIPGVLGTDIKKGEELLWANLKMGILPDSFMDPLAFNTNLTPLDGSAEKGGVIKRKEIEIKVSEFQIIDYINSLIQQLVSPEIGYIEGQDLFTFPYDWRYGVSGRSSDGTTVTGQLKGQIDYILNQTEAGKSAGKVDIIAHSTGGLLVKKYIKENPDNHHVNKAVFVGVPNLGAPKALKTLINGDNFDVFGLNPLEMKKISQNMPVIYDLAPSEEYYKQNGSFMRLINPFSSNGPLDKDLNYSEALQSLGDGKYINNLAIGNSQNLHTAEFDNMDLRNFGVDLYSIVGCKNATFGKLTQRINYNSLPSFDFPKVINGDKTVPFISANSLLLDSSKTYFAPKIGHGDLLSADGSRQQIVSIIAGKQLSTNGKILNYSEVKNRPDLCQIKGEQIKIKSPIEITAIDQNGNISGPDENGKILNNIPGADYEIWGEHKYVFLPTDSGQVYNIQLKGVGNGSFTLEDERLEGENTTQTQIFSNLPVTTILKGRLNLGEQNTLLLDNNGDGNFEQTVLPSTVLDPDQSRDLTPPVSTSTISGLMGTPGYYRSDINITLSANDPIVVEKESQTSGVLKISYQLDSGNVNVCPRESLSPQVGENDCVISIQMEGLHSLKYFSTDRAGNNELEQVINFVIDKSVPEFSVQFNPEINDFEFLSQDIEGLDQNLACSLKSCHVTDLAGNSSILNFNKANILSGKSLSLKSISYNTATTTLVNNLFQVYLIKQSGQIKMFNQTELVKQAQVLNINYIPKKNQSIITDWIKGVKPDINTQLGIKFLQILTNKATIKTNVK